MNVVKHPPVVFLLQNFEFQAAGFFGPDMSGDLRKGRGREEGWERGERDSSICCLSHQKPGWWDQVSPSLDAAALFSLPLVEVCWVLFSQGARAFLHGELQTRVRLFASSPLRLFTSHLVSPLHLHTSSPPTRTLHPPTRTLLPPTPQPRTSQFQTPLPPPPPPPSRSSTHLHPTLTHHTNQRQSQDHTKPGRPDQTTPRNRQTWVEGQWSGRGEKRAERGGKKKVEKDKRDKEGETQNQEGQKSLEVEKTENKKKW